MIEFKRRDFLYNNGLVNVFLSLYYDVKQKNKENYKVISEIGSKPPYEIIWNGIKISLSHNSLIFECNEEDLIKVYESLRMNFLSIAFEDEECVDTRKLYWDKTSDEIIARPTIQIKPLFQRTERIKDLQKKYGIEYVSKEKYEEILKKVELFKHKHPEFKKIKNDKIRYGAKEESLIPIFVYREKDEIINILIKDISISEGEPCIICGSKYTKLNDKPIKLSSTNLIYDFGESPPINRDHRIKKSLPLCFMCDLIYKYSLLYNFFWENIVFMFDLWSLAFTAWVKDKLRIKNSYEIREDKIRTNLPRDSFSASLTNPYFLLLKTLWSIYFKAIELRLGKYLLENLSVGQIVMFAVTNGGRDIDNSTFYNKLSYIFRFFENLKKRELEQFFKILIVYTFLKEKDKQGIIQKEFIKNLLYNQPIEKYISEASYLHFSIFNERKKKRGSFYLNTQKLYLFLKEYNLFMEENMEYEMILNFCSAIGKKIGELAAETDNKSLIYSIREIGNTDKLAEFFKDFEYEVLKADRGDILNVTDQKTNKKYFEIIKEILDISLKNKKSINIMRDIMAIFAIQRYMSVKYAKSQSTQRGEENE